MLQCVWVHVGPHVHSHTQTQTNSTAARHHTASDLFYCFDCILKHLSVQSETMILNANENQKRNIEFKSTVLFQKHAFENAIPNENATSLLKLKYTFV